MNKILCIIFIFVISSSFFLYTSCGKEDVADYKANKNAKSHTTQIEQIPGKAINKAQSAYDSANKELEKALQ